MGVKIEVIKPYLCLSFDIWGGQLANLFLSLTISKSPLEGETFENFKMSVNNFFSKFDKLSMVKMFVSSFKIVGEVGFWTK